VLDRASGAVVKKNPRFVIILKTWCRIVTALLAQISVLTSNVSAEVEIILRATSHLPAKPIPLEAFSSNKDMGRVLIRRGGETISAGIVLKVLK
jgi:elongation factor 1 alpha-like protein